MANKPFEFNMVSRQRQKLVIHSTRIEVVDEGQPPVRLPIDEFRSALLYRVLRLMRLNQLSLLERHVVALNFVLAEVRAHTPSTQEIVAGA